jgi:DnaK suppressor protein
MKIDLNKLEKIILFQIEETKELIQEYVEITRPVSPDNAIGRLSRMEALGSKSRAEFAERQAKKKLQNLETQLSQLHSSKFGKCQDCGNEIGLERIFFMPESLKCVNCSQ